MRSAIRKLLWQLILLIVATLPVQAATGAELELSESAISAAPARWSAPPASAGPLAPSAPRIDAGALPAGAVTVTEQSPEIITDLDDYDTEPVASIADPLEPWNRFWFGFNDIFYIHVAQPLYRGWSYIVPEKLRSGMSNLFYNTLFPTRFVNSLLQFRFMEAGVEFSRFMMNVMSTGGLGNPARTKKTIVPVDSAGEDFGQTLGRWGMGPGFYIVWPFIGPSSLRDTVGRIGDIFTDPIYYVQPWTLSYGSALGLRFNDVGEVLPAYTDLRSIAVDPYIAMREAYASMRRAQVLR